MLAWVITKEHKKKPDAFVRWWVRPPARYLVNRRQSSTPAEDEDVCSHQSWCFYVTLVSFILEVLMCVDMVSTQSIMCWVGGAYAVGFYAKVEWKWSHAGAALNQLYRHCQLDNCSHNVNKQSNICMFSNRRVSQIPEKKLRYHVNINKMTVFYSPWVNFIVQNDVNV